MPGLREFANTLIRSLTGKPGESGTALENNSPELSLTRHAKAVFIDAIREPDSVADHQTSVTVSSSASTMAAELNLAFYPPSPPRTSASSLWWRWPRWWRLGQAAERSGPVAHVAGEELCWRELRMVWRPVTVLAFEVVVASAAAVGVVAVAIPPLPASMAFVLGAILASIDPVAVTAFGRRLALPRIQAKLVTRPCSYHLLWSHRRVRSDIPRGEARLTADLPVTGSPCRNRVNHDVRAIGAARARRGPGARRAGRIQLLRRL